MQPKLTRDADGLTITLPKRRNLGAAIAFAYGLFLVVGAGRIDFHELSLKDQAVMALLVIVFLLALAAVFFGEDRIRITASDLRTEWKLFAFCYGRTWPLEEIVELRFDESESNLVLKRRGQLFESVLISSIDEETAISLMSAMRMSPESADAQQGRRL